MTDKSEQWKLKGQCSICRRKSYCKNICKANKENFKQEVFDSVIDNLSMKSKLSALKIMSILGGLNED